MMRYLLCVLCAFLVFPLFTLAVQAPQCGYADTINYPVDTSVFRLVQDFGVPSGRHQGRYHTGEDWYAGRVENYGYGLHVAAAATGRVTYSSPIGWGRDGGVVILEHTFPDGTVLYTQYGHMVELDTARFPTQYSCVRAGEIIGAVGNARPAPHLHFEIRVNNPDFPGPGYSWSDPVADGWRKPGKFILNWQAILQPAYRWHLDLADETGPAAPLLPQGDNSLLYLDANRLGRVTPDGRLLWRVNLERPAVGIIDSAGLPLLVYADGGIQRVNLDSTLSPIQETDIEIDSLPLRIGDTLLAHTPGNMLARFGIENTGEIWRLPGVKPIVRALAAGPVIGLMTSDNELLTVSPTGSLLDRAQLREPGSLAVSPDGHLLAYTRGGLWRILPDGVWEIVSENVPPGSPSSALVQSPDGSLYLFDGGALHAYNRDLAQIWAIDLADIAGAVTLTLHDSILLLVSNHGHIVAVRAVDGGLCGRARIFGSDRANAWHSLGSDGLLRVAVADQIIGLDWRTFLGGCA